MAIPAQPPVRLPAYTAVLADIGDEQSLSANLSTFSGHLKRIQVCSMLPWGEGGGRGVERACGVVGMGPGCRHVQWPP